MEVEACKDECKWPLGCNYRIVNNCPEEYCPSMPLHIAPDYAKSLIRRWEMTKNIILKTRYPLRCAESESSGDEQIERDSLEALTDGQEEEQSPSPLPCADSESWGGQSDPAWFSRSTDRWPGRGATEDPTSSTTQLHDGETSGVKRNSTGNEYRL